MKKSDLKVGVEYAVHLTPGAARRSWSRSEPVKATLVEIGGTVSEQLTVIGWNSYGKLKRYEDGPRTVAVKSSPGMVVDLAKPVRQGEISPSGVYVERSGSGYGRNHKLTGLTGYDAVEEYAEGWVSSQHARMVTRVSLENGACFVSTWADYEAEVAAQKAAEVRRGEQRAKDLATAQANEPVVVAKIERLLDLFRERGYSVEADYGYGEKSSTHQPDEYRALPPGASRHSNGVIVLDLHYHNTHTNPLKDDAQHPLRGATVSKMSADTLLDLLAP